ncbi:MAG TPA: hypothetical protein VNI78_00915 [Vicinamibacterales bacterium]|nr:hypothetical protein [Vicinamibacterales bacterium]
MTRSAELRALLPALYPVAALLVIAPIADVIGAAWPARPTAIAWRFGSLGLGLGVVIVQILGLALALAVAAAAGHRLVMRFVSIVCLLAAGALVAAITRFILDYGELRSAIAAADVASFDSSSFRAILLATLAVPVLVTLGGRGWSASRRATEAPTSWTPVRPRPRSDVIPFPSRPPIRPSGFGR